MPEWTNGHAWRACVPLGGTVGSNPTPSAFQVSGAWFVDTKTHPFRYASGVRFVDSNMLLCQNVGGGGGVEENNGAVG